jgi:CRISPR-associated endonuclease/helicase Cas3
MLNSKVGKCLFYSHAEKNELGEIIPTKVLIEHLREVGKAAQQYVAKVPYQHGEELAEAALLAGVCHDFGKYTSYFQDYLLKEKEQGQRHHHGFISAIYGAFHVQKHLTNYCMPYKKYLPLLIYMAILHHHGPLDDAEKTLKTPKRKLRSIDFKLVDSGFRVRLLTVRDQVLDLQKMSPEIEQEYRTFLEEPALQEFLENWLDVLEDLNYLYYDFEEEDFSVRLHLSFILYLLYSALIDADKNDAAGLVKLKRLKLPSNLVDRYAATNFSTPQTEMDYIRQEIYEKVMDKIKCAECVPLSHHLYTLTAPTGTGKTLTSLSAALKLRQRIEDDKSYSPRIIYALPFTSIIDQNYEVIKKVLSALPDFEEQENRYLLKHHHLTELRYLFDGEEENLNQALLRVESWEAEIVVTTFIQLLYSIVSYQNSYLKKFHNIAGSIILMDEVQNIDVEYWPLVRKALILLAKVTKCYIILLTATKPLIFKKGETIELLTEHYKYFQKLNRVTVYPYLEPLTIEEFCGDFVRNYESSQSYLLVLNTIKSSIKVYNYLKEKFPEACLFYLSTNIVPRERALRVKLIRRALRRKKSIIVVSTQVVEAGVDIDLHTVIRDLGPIDSIVQVAGRCNRHFNRNKGQVQIYRLVERERDYATMVYGKIHCQYAKELLANKISIDEKEFYDTIDSFFKEVSSAKNQDISDELLTALANFKFSTLKEFELIKDNPYYVDVFIEINEKARQVFQKYVANVLEEKDYKKRRENRLRLRRKFSNYVISVPVELARGLEQSYLEWGFLYLPLEGLDLYYKKDTGFIRIDEGTIIF